MKKSILISIAVIILAGSIISGATLAWFTDAADPIVNEFTAGTVVIEAEETLYPAIAMIENWNPGDCAEKEYTIVNSGTKGVYIRGTLTGKWYNEDGVTEFFPDPDEGVVTYESQGDQWIQIGDTFYYDESVSGSYTQSDVALRTITLRLKVCLDGPGTGNQYQGKVFKLTALFESVQSSNNAVHSVWPGNPYPVLD